MEFLIVYDISTVSVAGEKRLRNVAKICEGYGQRVQKSVFECRLDRSMLLRLQHQLVDAIEPRVDRVGIYRLQEPYRLHVKTLGVGPEVDWRGPVVL